MRAGPFRGLPLRVTGEPEHSEERDDRLWFRRRHRLSRDQDYQAVFEARVLKRKGPITVFTRPNGLDECRLGLSIGRRFGPAHDRVALKRRLREAFRHARPGLPVGYDVVITAGAHRPLAPEFYRTLITEAVEAGERQWQKRARKAASDSGETDTDV